MFGFYNILCIPVRVPQTTGGFLEVGPWTVRVSLASQRPAPVIGGIVLPPAFASAIWVPLPGDNNTLDFLTTRIPAFNELQREGAIICYWGINVNVVFLLS